MGWNTEIIIDVVFLNLVFIQNKNTIFASFKQSKKNSAAKLEIFCIL